MHACGVVLDNYMSVAVQVREAVAADVPAIRAIYNAAVAEPAAACEDEPHSLKQREDWFAQFQRRNFPVLVAEQGGVVIGWGSLGPHQERAGFRFTGSVAVYVDAVFRRVGVGSLLLKALMVAGKARRLHCVVAAIDSLNNPSIRLHEQHGFTEAGTLRQAGCKQGEWRDVVYLQRLLDERSEP